MPPLRSFISSHLFKPQTLTPLRYLASSPAAAGSASFSASNSGGVSLYLRRARLIDALRLRLHCHDPSKPFDLRLSSPLDSFVAVQVLRSATSTDLAVAFFRSLPLSHPSISHSLAKRLALSKRAADLTPLLDSLDGRVSPMDRLRYLAASGDVGASLRVWSEIRSAANRHPCTEAYNLVINLHASKRSDSAAIEAFLGMIGDGANPNSRTYTVIIDHLIRSGNLDPALEIFKLLPLMRIRRTSKQYNVLAEALLSSNRFEDLQSLIQEMKSDGILAGRSMREVISKLRSAGFNESTEEFVSELSPNEKIEYVVEDQSEDETDEEGGGEITGGERVQLKPWMDPTALARALNGWDPAEVKELESARFVWTTRLVCKILRSFKNPEPAWEFFCWVSYQPGGFAHDRQTLSRMISILARAGHVELIERLLSKLKSEQIQLPFSTVRLAIDFYGLSKRAEAAIKLYRNARSVCGPLSQSNQVLLCSSLLRTVVKCKRKNEAMELLEEMMAGGVLLDIQTFTGLMQFFAEEGDLKNVHGLFGLVRQCGLEPDGYMYRVLIRAYCKNGRAALGLRVFEEMRSAGGVPDRGTKGLLVRSLWKEGKLREAAAVEERCEGVEARIPAVVPGHVWTMSEADFRRVCDVYSGCFRERG